MVNSLIVVSPKSKKKIWSKLKVARGRIATAVLVVFAIILLVLTAMRFIGIDGNDYTASALALVPYAAVAGLLTGIAGLFLHRWRTAGVVLLLTIALASVVLPRAFEADQPAVNGRQLRVMAANLYYSEADPRTIVDLVRDNKVEVLSLLELNESMIDRLGQAGLFALLPHRVLHPAASGAGSGLVSRYPLSEEQLAGASNLAQPSARVDLGDGASVEVVAVHTLPPVVSAERWKSDLHALPKPTSDLPVRILAGDFNATLDHASLRELIDAGYADAADQRGEGLQASWPSGIFPPPVTIDHVLVDDRVAVGGYQVFDIPGSDHDAVYAELVIPVSAIPSTAAL